METWCEFSELIDDDSAMPSIKHSFVQTNIVGTLFNDRRFTTFVELSLDVSTFDVTPFGLKQKDELVPDVCVYREAPRVDEKLGSDVVRVTHYLDLAIEVLSPTQAINELLKKIEVYFALKVQSCWLAIPALEAIWVFSNTNAYQTFDMNDSEVCDAVMDIQIPIQRLFRQQAHAS